MLATMRPTASHLVSSNSRPSSPSPSQSPARNLSKQQQQFKNKSNQSNGNKSNNSQQRKHQHQQQRQKEMSLDDSNSVATATPAAAPPAPSSSTKTTKKQSTPGLITLSKPISQQNDHVEFNPPDSPSLDKASSSKKKSKKGGGKGVASSTSEQRSSSPSPPGNLNHPSQPLPVKGSSKNSKKSKAKSQSRKDGHNQINGPDPSQLSKSAPSSTHHSNTHKSSNQKHQTNSSHLLDSSGSWDMPATPPRKDASSNLKTSASSSSMLQSETTDSGLTWQQQLLGGAKSKSNSMGHSASHSVELERNRSMPKTGISGNSNSQKKSRDNEGSTDSSLTWQQALFASSKPRSTTGLAYDTFADARDAATFGGGDEDSQRRQPNGKGNRARSGSLGTRNHADSSNASIYIDDVFNNHSSPNVSRVSSNNTSMQPSTPIKAGNKSTPNKKNGGAGLNAYAGPNFHNSPSPASLPAPKFSRNSRNSGHGSQHPLADESTSSSNNSTGSGSEDSASESGGEDLDRSKRSVTAPADVEGGTRASEGTPSVDINRQTTIETLLARMMGTA